MRRVILIASVLLLFNFVFGQSNTKDYFLEKSKKQKTTAWILLGTGAAAIITEAIVDNSHRGTGQSLTGGILTVGGVLCTLTSIPFFISSSRNKRRAITFTINNEKTIRLQDKLFTSKNHPSISVHISLDYK